MSWYKMERGWHDSEIFKDHVYSDRDAWSWMVSEAVWEDTIKNILNNPVKLERGQFSHSMRFMSDKFKWTKSRVETFIKRLKKWDMVDVESRTGQNIVTISNYSKYQSNSDAEQTEIGQLAGQLQDKEKELKNLRTKEDIYIYIPEGVSKEIWEDFIILRKSKKAKITKTVINRIVKEAEKANWSVEEVLKEMCLRNWTSFKAEWVDKGEKYGTKNSYNSNKNNQYNKQEAGYLDKVKNAGELALANIREEELSMGSGYPGEQPGGETD